jgi:hypothetical protein
MGEATPSALELFDAETRRRMRDTIRHSLHHNIPLREACAEARGLARGLEPSRSQAEADTAILEILRADDIITPQMIALEWDRDGSAYREADDTEVCASLVYALRFDERGKPRKSGWDFMAHVGAMELVRRLQASNYLVLKGPPARNSA